MLTTIHVNPVHNHFLLKSTTFVTHLYALQVSMDNKEVFLLLAFISVLNKLS